MQYMVLIPQCIDMNIQQLHGVQVVVTWTMPLSPDGCAPPSAYFWVTRALSLVSLRSKGCCRCASLAWPHLDFWKAASISSTGTKRYGASLTQYPCSTRVPSEPCSRGCAPSLHAHTMQPQQQPVSSAGSGMLAQAACSAKLAGASDNCTRMQQAAAVGEAAHLLVLDTADLLQRHDTMSGLLAMQPGGCRPCQGCRLPAEAAGWQRLAILACLQEVGDALALRQAKAKALKEGDHVGAWAVVQQVACTQAHAQRCTSTCPARTLQVRPVPQGLLKLMHLILQPAQCPQIAAA